MKWITEEKRCVPLTLKKKEIHRSKRQDGFKKRIEQLFPSFVVYEEVNIPFTSLYIDLFISSLQVAIEVDSRLHDEFVPHFHKHEHVFKKAQANDKEKDRLCKTNNIKVVRLKKEKYSDQELIELIIG